MREEPEKVTLVEGCEGLSVNRPRAWGVKPETLTNPLHPDAPIVGADLHREVISAAGGRCECEGGCGRTHRKDGGRCRREGFPGEPLHAVPREPAEGIAAMRLRAGQLTALCDACHAGLLAQRRRMDRAAEQEAISDAPTLF